MKFLVVVDIWEAVVYEPFNIEAAIGVIAYCPISSMRGLCRNSDEYAKFNFFKFSNFNTSSISSLSVVMNSYRGLSLFVITIFPWIHGMA